MKAKIYHFILRHGFIIAGIVVSILLIWSWFKGLFEDILFAFLAVVFGELVAISLSNLALYLYTNISFTRGVFYGEDDRLNAIERNVLAKVIGQIFISVHVLVAIILSLLYWGKVGS